MSALNLTCNPIGACARDLEREGNSVVTGGASMTVGKRFGLARSELFLSLLTAIWVCGTPARTFAIAPVEAPRPTQTTTEAPAASLVVDFETQIRPILMRHCYECHGPVSAEGGLRLDNKHTAIDGGDSGQPIVGGTPETNELYRRVTVSDESERMPLGKPRLSDAEIELIRRWVSQGTPWPDSGEPLPDAIASTSAIPEAGSQQPGDSASEAEFPTVAAILVDRAKQRQTSQQLLFGTAALVLIVAVVEAARSRFAVFGRVRPWHYLFPFAVALAIGLLAFAVLVVDDYYRSDRESALRRHTAEKQTLTQRITYLEDVARKHGLEDVARKQALKIDAGQKRGITAIYGTPPVPLRPNHAKRIQGSYYRGNCERNHKLFNYGNYLTATFHIGLCAKDGRMLVLDDAIPSDGLFLKFELIRAPNTTSALYSAKIMESVMLTNVFEQPARMDGPGRIPLTTVEPDQRWLVYYPISIPESLGPDETTHSELIYVYKGKILHYAINCDLILRDGRIVHGSDVWMGNLFRGNVAEPQPGKIPLAEWFDDRPIPPIVGKNTTDPKLLGIPEHVPAGHKDQVTVPVPDEPVEIQPTDSL